MSRGGSGFERMINIVNQVITHKCKCSDYLFEKGEIFIAYDPAKYRENDQLQFTSNGKDMISLIFYKYRMNLDLL